MNEYKKRIMPCPFDHESQLKVIIVYSMSPSLWQKRFCLRIYNALQNQIIKINWMEYLQPLKVLMFYGSQLWKGS